MAVFQMASDAGQIVGPLAAGWLADHVGYGPAFAPARACSCSRERSRLGCRRRCRAGREGAQRYPEPSAGAEGGAVTRRARAVRRRGRHGRAPRPRRLQRLRRRLDAVATASAAAIVWGLRRLQNRLRPVQRLRGERVHRRAPSPSGSSTACRVRQDDVAQCVATGRRRRRRRLHGRLRQQGRPGRARRRRAHGRRPSSAPPEAPNVTVVGPNGIKGGVDLLAPAFMGDLGLDTSPDLDDTARIGWGTTTPAITTSSELVRLAHTVIGSLRLDYIVRNIVDIDGHRGMRYLLPQPREDDAHGEPNLYLVAGASATARRRRRSSGRRHA